MPSPVHPVRVIGPKDLRAAQASGELIVSTVSAAAEEWQRDLSPFFLGPVPLPGGREARCMENAWQYAKAYRPFLDAQGNPTEKYWSWAKAGWAGAAVRYPMGKGAKPEYLLWGEERLGYLEARKRVYWTLYRDAVRTTEGFSRLVELHRAGPLTLFDYDGYDHELRGMGLRQVSDYPNRPMGHAFVLKAMLLYGVAVEAEDLDKDLVAEAKRTTLPSDPEAQGALF